MANFQVTGINHVGLAPKSADKASEFFKILLSLPFLGEETVKEQKTHTVMFQSTQSEEKSSNARLELLIPTESESPIQKFLDKKGSGIHHLALTVTDVAAAISHLESHGIQMIDRIPRAGAHHTKIAFVHPSSAGGLLIELVEETLHK